MKTRIAYLGMLGLMGLMGCGGREDAMDLAQKEQHLEECSAASLVKAAPGSCSGSWQVKRREYTTCPSGMLPNRYAGCSSPKQTSFHKTYEAPGKMVGVGVFQYPWNSLDDCRRQFESVKATDLVANVRGLINIDSVTVNYRTGVSSYQAEGMSAYCDVHVLYTYCEWCLGKTSWLYSAPGLPQAAIFEYSHYRPLFLDIEKCLTCDAEPISAANASTVFACVDDGIINRPLAPREYVACRDGADGVVNSPECVAPTPPINMKDPVGFNRMEGIARLKLLFEMFASQLTEAQRARALQLYQGYPDTSPACGDTLTAATGTSVSYLPEYGNLQFCNRLASSHVPATFMDENYSFCVDTLHQLPKLANEKKLNVEEILNLSFGVFDKLLGRVFQSKAKDGSTEPSDYASFLKRVDIWYRATDAAIAGMNNLPLEKKEAYSKRLFTSLSGHLDKVYRQVQKNKTDLAAINQKYLSKTTAVGAKPEDLEVFQSELAQAGFARDTAILKVIYGNTISNGASGADWCKGTCPWQNNATLSGVPLLVMTNAALRQLSERVGLLAMFHDHACLFLGCSADNPPMTPVAKVFYFLGKLLELADERQVAEIFGSCSADNTEGFCEAARAVALSQGRLAQTFSREWLAISDQPMPDYARGLGSVINVARSYANNYARTGFFFGINTRGFQIGMSEKLQDNVRTLIDKQLGDLGGAKMAYENTRAAGISELLKLQEDAIAIGSLDKAIEQKTTEYDFLKQNLTEHKAKASESLKEYPDVMAAFQGIKSTIGGNALFEVKKDYEALNFTLSADDARYTPDDYRQKHILDPERWVAWSAREISGLKKGEIVSVTTANTWKPTCALTLPIRIDQATHYCGSCKSAPESWLGVPKDKDHNPVRIDVDPTQAETTARGYYGVWQGSALKARSWTDAQSTSTGFGLSALGIGANYGGSRQDGPANSKQFESRSAVSLESGIFLPQTPFSGHPAGSLIIVEAAGKKLLRVLDGGKPFDSFMVEGDPENPAAPISLHFIVNDLKWVQGNTGCDFDKTKAITVKVTVSEKKADAAEAVAQAMQQTIDELKKTTATDVFSVNLPSSANLLVENAMHLLQTKLAAIGLSMADFPELENTFRKFVLGEQLQTERKAKIQEIQHAMSLVELEIEARKLEKAEQEAKIQTLSSLMPSLRLNNYAGMELRGKAYQLMARVRDFLYPYLALKYPSVLREMSSIQAPGGLPVAQLLTELQQAKPGASIHDLITKFQLTTQALSEMLPWEQLKQKRAQKSNPVLLGFVKPGKTSTTEWPKASEELSRRVWDAFNRGTSVDIMIDPSDIIFQGGAATLQCEELIPIVTEMGFVALSPQATNVTPDNFSGTFSNQQFFAIANGLVEFELQNQGWQGFSTSMYYGETVAAYKGAEYVGLSPFSQFRIKPTRLVNGQPATFESKLRNLAVNELVLVMQIEYQRDGGRYSNEFVPACGL